MGNETTEPHPYGLCPECGVPGKTRERRPNGNDTCQNGHTYPSGNAIYVVKVKEPTFRKFKLFTNEENPEIDRLAIMVELLNEMPPNERDAAMVYLAERFKVGRA